VYKSIRLLHMMTLLDDELFKNF